MSPTGWHGRVLHREGQTGTAADRTIERTAIEAVGPSIYQLALVRRGVGEPRLQRRPSGRTVGAEQLRHRDMKTKLAARSAPTRSSRRCVAWTASGAATNADTSPCPRANWTSHRHTMMAGRDATIPPTP